MAEMFVNKTLVVVNETHRTQLSHYLKKCICMYLHTGVKRVCTKMSHWLTVTKKKHFLFLQLQVLKKLCTEKRAWWRDSTLETNSQSHNKVLNEDSDNKENSSNSYTVLVLRNSNCISTQNEPCASSPQSSVKTFPECAHKKDSF